MMTSLQRETHCQRFGKRSNLGSPNKRLLLLLTSIRPGLFSSLSGFSARLRTDQPDLATQWYNFRHTNTHLIPNLNAHTDPRVSKKQKLYYKFQQLSYPKKNWDRSEYPKGALKAVKILTQNTKWMAKTSFIFILEIHFLLLLKFTISFYVWSVFSLLFKKNPIKTIFDANP